MTTHDSSRGGPVPRSEDEPAAEERAHFPFELRPVDAWIGVGLGVSIWAMCMALLYASLWYITWAALEPIPRVVCAVAVVLAQTMLYTGLFITAHDAMHGTACWRSARINALLGQVAIGSYALFSLRKMRIAHADHHGHPAMVGKDPDFHDGEHRGFWAWYGTFLWRYVSVWQILGMALVFNLLAHGAGIAQWKLLVFWVMPAMLSTVQLFYFGTYLPHRERDTQPYPDGHRARSNGWSTWLSLLTCYHFGGFHHEHHGAPHAPWWRLPEVGEEDRA